MYLNNLAVWVVQKGKRRQCQSVLWFLNFKHEKWEEIPGPTELCMLEAVKQQTLIYKTLSF